MMNIQEIAYQYVQACKTQAAREETLNNALAAFCSDNQVFDLANSLHTAYRQVVLELVGEHMMDWIEWWQYEAEYGEASMDFQIDGEAYNTADMTFYKFWELTFS